MGLRKNDTDARDNPFYVFKIRGPQIPRPKRSSLVEKTNDLGYQDFTPAWCSQKCHGHEPGDCSYVFIRSALNFLNSPRLAIQTSLESATPLAAAQDVVYYISDHMPVSLMDRDADVAHLAVPGRASGLHN